MKKLLRHFALIALTSGSLMSPPPPPPPPMPAPSAKAVTPPAPTAKAATPPAPTAKAVTPAVKMPAPAPAVKMPAPAPTAKAMPVAAKTVTPTPAPAATPAVTTPALVSLNMPDIKILHTGGQAINISACDIVYSFDADPNDLHPHIKLVIHTKHPTDRALIKTDKIPKVALSPAAIKQNNYGVTAGISSITINGDLIKFSQPWNNIIADTLYVKTKNGKIVYDKASTKIVANGGTLPTTKVSAKKTSTAAQTRETPSPATKAATTAVIESKRKKSKKKSKSGKAVNKNLAATTAA